MTNPPRILGVDGKPLGPSEPIAMALNVVYGPNEVRLRIPVSRPPANKQESEFVMQIFNQGLPMPPDNAMKLGRDMMKAARAARKAAAKLEGNGKAGKG